MQDTMHVTRSQPDAAGAAAFEKSDLARLSSTDRPAGLMVRLDCAAHEGLLELDNQKQKSLASSHIRAAVLRHRSARHKVAAICLTVFGHLILRLSMRLGVGGSPAMKDGKFDEVASHRNGDAKKLASSIWPIPNGVR
jgi:hypothetical protein